MYLDDDEEKLAEWLYSLSPEVRAAQLLMVAPDPEDDPDAVVERVQFVAADGTRVFDLAGFVASLATELLSAAKICW